jgi:hypothetical protein
VTRRALNVVRAVKGKVVERVIISNDDYVDRVIAVGNVIMYTSSSWLARTNADTLALDAALGHYASQDLRKEIAPYLKQ